MGTAQPQRRRSARTPERTSPWQDAATALLPVLACFLGGATEKWAEGTVVALLGMLLVWRPPRASPGAAVNVIVVALMLLAATAFLPARWFMTSAWRAALTDDFGIVLPASLSPQPWVSANCLASLLAGIAWLYYVAGQDLNSRGLRRQLRFFAGGVVALAVVSLVLYFTKAPLPFWHNQRGFGPFPNRNQTGDLLGISAVVVIACAHDEIRHGRRTWIAWVFGLIAIVAAIVLNFSRAGIVILIGAFALWLGALTLRRGSAVRIAVGISVLLALMAALLLFGGQTLERFNFRGADATGGVSADFRWLIFRDALALIRTSPWCGIGLGNFQPVFAVFREASLAQNRALHPESDWLWLASEMGWSAVVLVLVGAFLLGRRVFPLREGTNMRLRLAAFVAALLFALHGLADVSAHRVGSAYAGLLLCGLALLRPSVVPRNTAVVVVARVFGLLLAIVGTTWLIASVRAFPLPGGIGVDRERRLASEANAQRDFAATVQHASRGLEWAPLDWQLYFVRAIGKVGLARPAEEALEDFRRARFLEPGSYEVPYQEGLTWSTQQPLLTMTAWREALRRAGPERPVLFGRMLSAAAQVNRALVERLEDFGSGQPDLALVLLERANGSSFKNALEHLLERDRGLQGLEPEQRARLFQLWSERGDLRRLRSLVAQQPELLSLAWQGVAKDMAAQENFREAVELVQRFAAAPKLPPAAPDQSIEQLQQKIFASRNNYEAGLALFQKQMSAGMVDDALITVRRFTDQPDAPAYFHFLEANAWSAKQDWERSWTAWQKFDPSLR